jgi:hypothetical protein
MLAALYLQWSDAVAHSTFGQPKPATATQAGEAISRRNVPEGRRCEGKQENRLFIYMAGPWSSFHRLKLSADVILGIK